MIDKKLTNIGILTIINGKIELEGFEARGASCREVQALTLLWAIGELQKELSAIVAAPGGTGICRLD